VDSKVNNAEGVLYHIRPGGPMRCLELMFQSSLRASILFIIMAYMALQSYIS
jgi:hypothetical protein